MIKKRESTLQGGPLPDMNVSKNGGTQQTHGVFLLKMIILGCFGGTPILGNTHRSRVKHLKLDSEKKKMDVSLNGGKTPISHSKS